MNGYPQAEGKKKKEPGHKPYKISMMVNFTCQLEEAKRFLETW